MFKIIVPKIILNELEKINKNNQQLIFNKIKSLEKGIFTTEYFDSLVSKKNDATYQSDGCSC